MSARETENEVIRPEIGGLASGTFPTMPGLNGGTLRRGGPGRPARKPFLRALQLARRTRIEEGATGKLKRVAGRRRDVAAALGLLEAAAAGDAAAFKIIADRIDGPINDEDSAPAQIQINLISLAPGRSKLGEGE